tara:strand:+ start:14782 stop:16419 length:1638 start_codon:yes stop_codon:yes gene_type:complete
VTTVQAGIRNFGKRVAGGLRRRLLSRLGEVPLSPRDRSIVEALGKSGLPSVLGVSENDYRFLREKVHLTDEDIAGYFINGLLHGGTFFHFYPQIAAQLLNSGYPREAVRYYEKFLGTVDDIEVHFQYLNACLLDPDSTNESLLEMAKGFARLYGVPEELPAAPQNDPDPDRLLKIGFICGFFDSSVMKDGILPTIKGRDPAACKTYCYSDGPIPQDFVDAPDHWRETGSLSDMELFNLIRRDGIDILRDLDGPTGQNRLEVFRMRPAPIAIHGANYRGTSGLSCYDWVLASEYSLRPGEEEFLVENVCRGDPFYGASINGFIDSDRFPACPPPPCIERNYVTFGYFGGAHKLNADIFCLWADIFRALPNARLVLKASGYSIPRIRTSILTLAADSGMDTNRIDLQEPSDFDAYIREYAKVDIILDTLPHSGGANIVEALWMGRPVISMYGNRWSSRTGADYLRLLGREELIAHNPAEYAELAISLATDQARIAALTDCLRTQFASSALADVENYNKTLENGYREMWSDWCRRQAPAQSIDDGQTR